jgi:hypothetical protein
MGITPNMDFYPFIYNLYMKPPVFIKGSFAEFHSKSSLNLDYKLNGVYAFRFSYGDGNLKIGQSMDIKRRISQHYGVTFPIAVLHGSHCSSLETVFHKIFNSERQGINEEFKGVSLSDFKRCALLLGVCRYSHELK